MYPNSAENTCFEQITEKEQKTKTVIKILTENPTLLLGI